MANPPKQVNCRDVINAANKALDDKGKALDLANLAIDQCKHSNGDLQGKVDQTNDELSKWYRQPIVMFLFGAAAGSLAYGLLRK